MSHAPVPPEFSDILRAFPLPGRFVSAAPYGSGHINETYATVFEQNGKTRRYILQKINHRIFKNVPALMDNVRRVTEHITARVRRESGDAAAGRTLTLVPTTDGNSYVGDTERGFWRTYDFIEGAHTVDKVTNESEARTAARTFGDFQAQLADLPGRLQDTIPNFHHTRSRFENFRKAVKEDTQGRAKDVQPEIEFAFSREADADVLLNLLAAGKMTERVTHNDTKINNVMLDDATGRAVAVIDLDTVMPGLPLYDLGEMVRTSTSSTFEDDPKPENMRLQLPLFRAVVEGYLASSVGQVLSDAERANLGFAGKLMSYENGLRFLTDYLQGDVYYKTKHARHNLERCRTQFALVRSIEAQKGEMDRIVAESGKRR